MMFSQKVQKAISPFKLLEHPFYQKWTEGKISLSTLQTYSDQYRHHVEAFPRYLSATHSMCEDSQIRRVLLENLNEEEGLNGKPHPELWTQFAEALGLTKSGFSNSKPIDSIKKLIENFMELSRQSVETGLGALYAYESQVPEIAETKLTGLKKHYQIQSERALEFFEVHQTADVYHREALDSILDSLPGHQHQACLHAATLCAQSLWNFLDEMNHLDQANAS